MAKRGRPARKYSPSQEEIDESAAQDESASDAPIMENLHPARALELERRSVFSEDSAVPNQPPIVEGSS